GRLEIAMHHAGGLRRVEPPAQALRDLERAPARQGAELEPIGERLAAHVLHDDEGRITDDEIEEARDVGVLYRRHRLGLVLEALAKLGIGEQLGLEQLDRDTHTDGDVLRNQYLAHAAVAQRLDQAVAAADDVTHTERLLPDQLGKAVGHGADA